jgi:hypothetical protein
MENTLDDSFGIFLHWTPLESQLSGSLLPVKEAVLKTTDTEFTVFLASTIELIIDLWDLGEFDQKGTTRTKWGTFEELKSLSNLMQEKNMKLYFDAVLNHKAAADEKEKCMAITCEWDGTISLILYTNSKTVRKLLENQLKLMLGWVLHSLEEQENILT